MNRQSPLSQRLVLMFLPGAGGDISLWQKIGQELTHRGERQFVAWPGFDADSTLPMPSFAATQWLGAR